MSISHVFDTYAKTSQGKIIHFDVVLNEQDQQKAVNNDGLIKDYCSANFKF